MNQPDAYPGQQGSKRCWACTESGPYSKGFCENCWPKLPLSVQVLYFGCNTLAEPYGGAVRTAIAETLRSLNRKPVKFRQLSLEELDL